MTCLVIKLACFQLMIMLLLGISGKENSPEYSQKSLLHCTGKAIANKVTMDLLATAVQQCFNSLDNCMDTGMTIPFQPGDMFYPLW